MKVGKHITRPCTRERKCGGKHGTGAGTEGETTRGKERELENKEAGGREILATREQEARERARE